MALVVVVVALFSSLMMVMMFVSSVAALGRRVLELGQLHDVRDRELPEVPHVDRVEVVQSITDGVDVRIVTSERSLEGERGRIPLRSPARVIRATVATPTVRTPDIRVGGEEFRDQIREWSAGVIPDQSHCLLGTVSSHVELCHGDHVPTPGLVFPGDILGTEETGFLRCVGMEFHSSVWTESRFHESFEGCEHSRGTGGIIVGAWTARSRVPDGGIDVSTDDHRLFRSSCPVHADDDGGLQPAVFEEGDVDVLTETRACDLFVLGFQPFRSLECSRLCVVPGVIAGEMGIHTDDLIMTVPGLAEVTSDDLLHCIMVTRFSRDGGRLRDRSGCELRIEIREIHKMGLPSRGREVGDLGMLHPTEFHRTIDFRLDCDRTQTFRLLGFDLRSRGQGDTIAHDWMRG